MSTETGEAGVPQKPRYSHPGCTAFIQKLLHCIVFPCSIAGTAILQDGVNEDGVPSKPMHHILHFGKGPPARRVTIKLVDVDEGLRGGVDAFIVSGHVSCSQHR